MVEVAGSGPGAGPASLLAITLVRGAARIPVRIIAVLAALVATGAASATSGPGNSRHSAQQGCEQGRAAVSSTTYLANAERMRGCVFISASGLGASIIDVSSRGDAA